MAALGKAFILGAGLGKRLRPLTEHLPKPLVPFCNRPLITYAFDHLAADLGTGEFMVNAHHCPQAYDEAFPDGRYRDRPVRFRHEPVLLDTAGGIDNVRDWLPEEESFAVYNGDILTDLPLGDAWARHLGSGDLATLVLRSAGNELRVGFDPDSGKVVDLRGLLQPDWSRRYQFTGVYFLSPAFLEFLKPGKIESIVLPLVEAVRSGNRVGGVVVDEGLWSDLGERESYLGALSLVDEGFPAYGTGAPPRRVAASAKVAEGATIDRLSTVGDGAVVGAGAALRESVVWPGARVEAGAQLRRVVVRTGRSATGTLENVDI
ncbi:MAG: sugar phosphate nucleotidyltransferase [Verrucomicrobiales bacterium]